jgi:ABC-type lipoprotein export system ATPase subunit
MLTARENVELVLGLRGIDGVESHERAMDALAIVGLADHAARRVDRLSAGERERVALARSIASGPGVLVADEPTARLDSATTLAIGGLLADLAREHGTTVICATHDPLLVTLAGAEVALRRTTPAAV